MRVTPSSSLDPDYLDFQYNVRDSVADFEQYPLRYRRLSNAAMDSLRFHPNVPYGDGRAEKLDIFPAAQPDAPVMIFIHGGYWRALSKADSSFMAPAFTAAGACVVVVGYELVPNTDLDGIVGQIRRALSWVFRHIAEYGGNPERLFACGNSAGGHLVGMLLATGWHQAFGVPQNVLRGAVPISGLFDLAPIRQTFVNEWMRLSEESALRNSPIAHLPQESSTQLIVCHGGLESDEFARQSTSYLQHWTENGLVGRGLVSFDRNHFDVVLDLGDPTSALFKAVCVLMDLSPPE